MRVVRFAMDQLVSVVFALNNSATSERNDILAVSLLKFSKDALVNVPSIAVAGKVRPLISRRLALVSLAVEFNTYGH